MVTKLLRKWARHILRKDLSHLNTTLHESFGSVHRLHDQLQQSRKSAFAYRERASTIADYLNWLERKSRGTSPLLLFIRDYLRDGSEGPFACSHGVHPAARWNIESFFDWQEEKEREDDYDF